MKTVITTLVLFFSMYSGYSRARIPIPYGTEEKIIKVFDFPDTESFLLEDGSYFDLGSKYTKSHLVWLSYSNTEPTLVGYVEGGDSYLELSADQLAEIEKQIGTELPKEGSVSFFDKFLGKGILGILGLIILYSIYSSVFNKDKEEEEEEGEE